MSQRRRPIKRRKAPRALRANRIFFRVLAAGLASFLENRQPGEPRPHAHHTPHLADPTAHSTESGNPTNAATRAAAISRLIGAHLRHNARCGQLWRRTQPPDTTALTRCSSPACVLLPLGPAPKIDSKMMSSLESSVWRAIGAQGAAGARALRATRFLFRVLAVTDGRFL